MARRGPIHVIGAGLAGSQAALTIARLGGRVVLHEMRPVKQTAAHRTAMAAELVCSNSLRSDQAHSTPWLLKQELRMLDSDVLQIATETAIPGGSSLTVDRDVFSRRVTEALATSPNIQICLEEVTAIPDDGVCVIATGPLTGDALARSIQELTGEENLSFFDALNPILEGDSIDLTRTFAAARHAPGADDFVNCPLTRDEYLRFHAELVAAESHTGHDFETGRFLGCPPLEKLARSGVDTLRYGPMRPVGLSDPATGHVPYAVVQLRRENLRSDSFNMVGFQNQLKWSEQKRVFRMIPGLEAVEFVRFGQMHRNTYLRAPRLLTPALNLRTRPDVFVAGQLCGVEGYVESIATGLIAGLNAWRRSIDRPLRVLPRLSGLGSICHYLAHADADDFAPVRLTFDLLPPVEERQRQARRERQCLRALDALAAQVDALRSDAA